jgi:GT2 family glycosyltransferase
MFSVIVLYHSGADLLRLCIESLINSTPESVEILVVMNNSDRGKLNVEFPKARVRCIKIEESLGYSKAANLGANSAKGQHLIFADHDNVFKQGWFEALTAHHCSGPKIGISSCRILNPHSFKVLDFGIGFTDFNSPHPHLDLPTDSPLVSKSRQVQAACTGGFLISKDLFNRLGGFDEHLGNIYCDIDLCLRLKDFDLECWVVADAEILHFGGDFFHTHRQHKAGFLKSDIKSYARAKNNHRITLDMEKYYQQSWEYYQASGWAVASKYVGVSMMNVADPMWYVNVMQDRITIIDPAILPTGNRDASAESMYESLGFEFLNLRTPIAYLVDRFVCLQENKLWWEKRPVKNDIVIDRNGNILPIAFAK